MSFIDLRIGAMVQGTFEPSHLNILLCFQVNCPGCLTHALPLASAFYELYQPQGVQMLGLSTVFEDFSLNTEKNTRKLIEEGHFVGETARYFQLRGLARYEESIAFPVAMDALGLDGIGQTFAKNNFRGTPTWGLFDSELQVEATWFGHKDKQEVMRLIDGLLK